MGQVSSYHKIIRLSLVFIAGIILIGGLIAGLFLFKQNQDLRQSAFVDSGCGQSADCVKIDPGLQDNSRTVDRPVDHVLIKAGDQYYTFPGDTSNCYLVTIDGLNVSWKKIGPPPGCSDISHVEIWLQSGEPTIPPSITNTPIPSNTPLPSNTPNPSYTPNPTLTLTPQPSNTPNPSHTPKPTATLTPKPTTTTTPQPSHTPGPTATNNPKPSATLVPNPTATPLPSSDNSTPTTCCVGDRVVIDANQNGIQEVTEKGLTGVRVEVFNSSNTLVGSAYTDANGYYKICDLPPGSYTIKFIMPPGYGLSSPGLGSDPALDSDPNSQTSFTQPVVLSASQTNLTIDALAYTLGTSIALPVAGGLFPTLLLFLLGTTTIFIGTILFKAKKI